jgi:hypothetical protein
VSFLPGKPLHRRGLGVVRAGARFWRTCHEGDWPVLTRQRTRANFSSSGKESALSLGLLGCSYEGEERAGFQTEPFLDHAIGAAGFEDRVPVLDRLGHGRQ